MIVDPKWQNKGLIKFVADKLINNAINAIEQFVGIYDISSYGKIILNGDNILETLQ